MRPLALPRLEAERQLVGACIDYRDAISVALFILPVHPFRSEDHWFLDGVFYMLAHWYDDDTFSERNNRDRLAAYFVAANWPKPDMTIAEAQIWLEPLFCGYGSMPEYVEQICRELTFRPLLVPASLGAKGAARRP